MRASTYTIEDRGVQWFLDELARRRGRPLQPARPFTFVSSGDRPGWIQSSNGRWHYTLVVENGRLSDFPNRSLLTGLRSIATSHSGLFSLTTNQNITIAGVDTADKAGIERLLRDYGIENSHRLSPVRQSAIACVAFPTCALAMAESERYMPAFMSKLESLMEEVGVAGAPINVRMSGCPNGCSRPYLGEIALVGNLRQVQPLSRCKRFGRPLERAVPGECRRGRDLGSASAAADPIRRRAQGGRVIRRLRREDRRGAADAARS